MKIKQFLIITIFISSLCHIGFCQLDYRKGYVITYNNDTLYGLIDYKTGKNNSKECLYRNDANSAPIKYGPRDIRAFRFIDSKFYVAREIQTENIRDSLFLEFLIDGIVDVYYFRDPKGNHYLVDKGDNKLIELKNEEKEFYVNNVRYVKQTNEYIGVLKAIFRESPSISKKVESTPLNHKSLIAISKDFHNEVCKDRQCIIYEKSLPGLKVTWGPTIALNLHSLKTMDDYTLEYSYFYDSDFNRCLNLSAGLFFKFNMPYINERLFAQYEITFDRSKVKSTSRSYNQTTNIYEINTISITSYILHNYLIIRYEFPRGKIKPIFQAGGFCNYVINRDYTRFHEVLFGNGDPYYDESSKDSPLSNVEAGFLLGAGCIYNITESRNICFDLRYEIGMDINGFFLPNQFSFCISYPLFENTRK